MIDRLARIARRIGTVPACIAAGLLVVLATIGLNRPSDGPAIAVVNPTLEPATLARMALERSATQWIAIIRHDGAVTLDFAPILEDAAAFRTLRYGIDNAEPDRDMTLPWRRDAWPLDRAALRDHLVSAPRGTRFVSVGVVFNDGTPSPVLLFRLPANGR